MILALDTQSGNRAETVGNDRKGSTRARSETVMEEAESGLFSAACVFSGAPKTAGKPYAIASNSKR